MRVWIGKKTNEKLESYTFIKLSFDKPWKTIEGQKVWHEYIGEDQNPRLRWQSTLWPVLAFFFLQMTDEELVDWDEQIDTRTTNQERWKENPFRFVFNEKGSVGVREKTILKSCAGVGGDLLTNPFTQFPSQLTPEREFWRGAKESRWWRKNDKEKDKTKVRTKKKRLASKRIRLNCINSTELNLLM